VELHHDSTIRLPAYTGLTLHKIKIRNFIFHLTNVPQIVVVIHRGFPCVILVIIIVVISMRCRYA